MAILGAGDFAGLKLVGGEKSVQNEEPVIVVVTLNESGSGFEVFGPPKQLQVLQNPPEHSQTPYCTTVRRRLLLLLLLPLLLLLHLLLYYYYHHHHCAPTGVLPSLYYCTVVMLLHYCTMPSDIRLKPY